MRDLFIIASTILFFTSCNSPTEDIEARKNKIAVFGGSIACRVQGDATKAYWRDNLGVGIDTYAVGGAGYTDWRGNTIQTQIEKANNYAYYLLWCSSNDHGQAIEIEGEPYSPKSQNGGIRTAVQTIRANNRAAKIIAFTSLPSIDGRDLTKYVEAQRKLFYEINIPYLEQFHLFDEVDIKSYYFADGQHLTVEGYALIRDVQLEFLKKQIK